METMDPIAVAELGSEAKQKQSLGAIFNRQVAAFEKARFGWMAILLTAQSCLGSIACMFILLGDASTLLLSGCAAVTMGSNAVFISQVNGKWSLGAFYVSVIINLSIILTNLPLGN